MHSLSAGRTGDRQMVDVCLEVTEQRPRAHVPGSSAVPDDQSWAVNGMRLGRQSSRALSCTCFPADAANGVGVCEDNAQLVQQLKLERGACSSSRST